MTVLRLLVDAMLDPADPAASDYTSRLARALIRHAPEGSSVAGWVSSSPEPEYALLERALPGLDGLEKSAFTRGVLRGAWRRGLAPRRVGYSHAPSLFAPLGQTVEELGIQLTVTLADPDAWTAPDSLPRREREWTLAMAARAARFADAVIVPDHVTAAVLDEELHLGERVRVLPGAPGGRPEGFPSAGEATPRDPEGDADPEGDGDPEGADADPHRVALAGSEPALRAALERIPSVTLVPPGAEGAELLVATGPGLGFALPVLDALEAGTPVVHAADPRLSELLAGAGHEVAVGEGATGLAEAVEALLADSEERERLAVSGRDRAGLYSWTDTAERLWLLHAEI